MSIWIQRKSASLRLRPGILQSTTASIYSGAPKAASAMRWTLSSWMAGKERWTPSNGWDQSWKS